MTSPAIDLKLGHREPLDGSALLEFFGARAVPGVERLTGGSFARLVDLADGPGIVRLAFEDGEFNCRLTALSRNSQDVGIQMCRAALDLDANAGVYDVLSEDPALATLVEKRPGLRVPGAFGGFEIALRAVIGQQVSVKGARTLAGRLVQAYGRAVEAGDDGLTHLFPTPDVIADAGLAEIGMPNARREAIRGLARAVAEGRIDLSTGADPEETHARLVELPGIGEWTASYICMRALKDPDAFLPGDLGVRKGAAALGLPTSRRALIEYSRRWEPFRAYAVMYLWTAARPSRKSRGNISGTTGPGGRRLARTSLLKNGGR